MSLVSEDVINACGDFRPLYDTLPRQLIHRDMHLQNLMFDNGKFTGYIDFDISQRNARLFDICYMGVLLIGEYTNPERIKVWRTIFTNILRGYNDILPLSRDELEAIPMLCVVVELTFTCFFDSIGQHEISKDCANMTEWLYKNLDKIPQSV